MSSFLCLSNRLLFSRLQRSGVLLVLCLTGCASELPPSDPTSPVSAVPHAVQEKSTSPSDGGLFSGLEDDALSTKPIVNARGRIRFVDVHDDMGVRFVFDNGASPRKLMPTSTSGGAAWLDYDRDGWCDLYFPQGGDFAAASWRDQPADELSRSLAAERFEPVTTVSRLTDSEFGHGVSIGDLDNDGFDDIYVCNVGRDVLFRNLGDGTFEDVTEAAGIDNPAWAASAAWGDLDGDGDLDLYVCNYMDYDPRNPQTCLDEQSNPATCNPTMVDDVPNVCYFNNGDGRFVEGADRHGLNGEGSKSLGVMIADLTGDERPDVFVANDTTANHLFVNQGAGEFVESALALGCALSGLGQFQASMGIGFGDYDRNGWPDLYVTHYTTDSNTLYQNLGPAGFTDETRPGGLHQPTLPYLGFGTVMADFDADGWHDLFVANGHIDDFRKRSGDQWKMPAQLFAFDGHRWHEIAGDAGPYFEREWLGRAVASSDYDRDGDLDLAVLHQNELAALLRNDSRQGHWLQFEVIGRDSNRNGIGTIITVQRDSRTLVQELPGGTSYCASHERLLHFGLGDDDGSCHVSIRWPSGQTKELTEVTVDQRVTLLEERADSP